MSKIIELNNKVLLTLNFHKKNHWNQYSFVPLKKSMVGITFILIISINGVDTDLI